MTHSETYPRPLNGHARGTAPLTAAPASPAPGTVPPTGAAAPPATATRETAGMQDLKTTPKTPAPDRPTAALGASVPLARTSAPTTEEKTPPAPAAAQRRMSERAMRWVVGVSIVAAVVVAAIGFIGSYQALADLARDRGFGWFSRLFPIGIDAGIIGMYGLDLLLVWLRAPKPLPRMIAHVLTAATIVFNAAAAKGPITGDLLGAFMHAALPLLFVGAVETARHLIIRLNNLSRTVESDQVPLHRWLLAPWSAWAVYRRMRLRGITSYAQVVKMDRDLDVYKAWLQHNHGRGWKSKAGATALLPFEMARYGLSVEEALDQPRIQQEAADQRAAAEAARIAAAAAAERDRQLDAKENAADAQIREMSIEQKVTVAQHTNVAARTAAEAQAKADAAAAIAAAATAEHAATLAAETGKRKAERDVEKAEREAERVEAAEKTAAEREAEARAARAQRQAAEDAKAAAEARAAAERAKAEAAATEQKRARDAAATQAEVERLEAERLHHIAQQAEAERLSAIAAAETARAREEAARAELAAIEAEDFAGLQIGERAERRVARMILAAWRALPEDERPAQPDMYAITLEQVQEALGVSRTIAGQRRTGAAQLISEGYTG
ncbi:DUF2637 domain-containing protein [Streptomyces hydrogenans]